VTKQAKNKPWTTEDDEHLREQIIAGATLRAVSQKLGRTEAAIKARAHLLKLSLRTIGGKRRASSRWV
jgi:hypothetical protein